MANTLVFFVDFIGAFFCLIILISVFMERLFFFFLLFLAFYCLFWVFVCLKKNIKLDG